MEQVDLKKIYDEIGLLKKIVISMKEDFDDRFLSAEDEEELEKSRKEYLEGKCVSLEDLRKELDV